MKPHNIIELYLLLCTLTLYRAPNSQQPCTSSASLIYDVNPNFNPQLHSSPTPLVPPAFPGENNFATFHRKTVSSHVKRPPTHPTNATSSSLSCARVARNWRSSFYILTANRSFHPILSTTPPLLRTALISI